MIDLITTDPQQLERFREWEHQLNTDWLKKCPESYAEYGRRKAAELDKLRKASVLH